VIVDRIDIAAAAIDAGANNHAVTVALNAAIDGLDEPSDFVQLLLAHNADPDWVKPHCTQSTFERTIYLCSVDACRLLIKHRGGVHTGPNREVSPLLWGIRAKSRNWSKYDDHCDILRLLLQHGCWAEPITPALESALVSLCKKEDEYPLLPHVDIPSAYSILKVYNVFVKTTPDVDESDTENVHRPLYEAIDESLLDEGIDALRQGAIPLFRDKEIRDSLLYTLENYPKETQDFIQLVCTPWSTRTHHIQSNATRVCIRTALLVNVATNIRGLEPFIPTEMWKLVCSFIAK